MPPERREIPAEARGPEVRDVKFDNAYDTQEEHDQVYAAVLKFVEERKLQPDNVGARGFEGTPAKIAHMLKTGVESPTAELFVAPIKNIPNTDDVVTQPDQSPMSFADMYSKRALALYDLAKLKLEARYVGDAEYRPNSRDGVRRALLAVFKLPDL